jgi:hypothetical protein
VTGVLRRDTPGAQPGAARATVIAFGPGRPGRTTAIWHNGTPANPPCDPRPHTTTDPLESIIYVMTGFDHRFTAP